MAGRIREESITAVREATDLVALIGEYVALRPAGGSRMKGLCPFHQEKTPSFTVNPDRGIWICFGCGESGDGIDFLMKHASLSFIEAIERLAQRAGVELAYEGRAPGERGRLGRKSRLVAAHAEAVGFYHRLLLEHPDAAGARAYLAGRGYDRAAAERFRLGWAPAASWDALTTHLRKAGFRDDELTEAGLARRGSRGLRDTFHARILFPVMDLAGDPVAFGGRLLDQAARNAPKYINTPETPIWHKGRVLYALNLAKQPIVQAGFALVVEGYTDVLSLHLAGIEQAVATCGTSLRADHFKVLSKFTDKVILAFDADSAGSKAADRGMAELISIPDAAMSAHVLSLPDGLDPADFVARHGAEAFRRRIEAARPLVQWWLESELARRDLRTMESRLRAARELVPLIQQVPDDQQRMATALWVSRKLDIPDFDHRYQAMVRGDRVARQATTIRAPAKRSSVEERIERDALKLALQYPDWTKEAATRWEEDWFTTPANRAAYTAVVKAGGVGSPFADVLEQAADERERRYLRALAAEAFAGLEDRGYADEVFRRLEELRLTRSIGSVKATLQRMNPVEQPDHYNQVFEDLIALEARRRVLREAGGRG